MFRKQFALIERETERESVCVCVCRTVRRTKTKAVSSEALKYLLTEWLQQTTNNALHYAQSDATYFHVFKHSHLS